MANEKTTGTYGKTILVSVAIVALLLGILGTYVAFPRTIEVEKKVSVENPVNTQLQIDNSALNAENAQLKADLADQPDTSTSSGTGENYLDTALNDFLDSLENDDDYDDYLKCGGDRYDFDQISVNRIYDDVTIKLSEVDTDDLDDAKATDVEFKLRLKYKDIDVEDKCYQTLDIKVEYEEGEEPNILISD